MFFCIEYRQYSLYENKQMKGSCHRRELSRACCRVGHLAVTRYKTSCRRLHAFYFLL
ncbi:hypothetical protein HMPREF0673_02647 [Leyella stercorea DSM 18206]|uniref:Uncharacterized protein n=1 Tax=Leyella stercorea DSM 18206 TaxID=1002367 RepID=G6B177_9BACT|nr:hypothetical protein HMPREF0673_02647 [Leyella stercorea DSM 18206]